MILEAIITTLSPEGSLNIAPMGPLLAGGLEAGFVLRPFQTATTFANLSQRGEGVLHVTDDVLLLAQAAVGRVPDEPETFPARRIGGRVLADCCRWAEFEVADIDTAQPRAAIQCRVVHVETMRDHFGFNRAKHAVLEAAILATRVHLLPREEIAAEFDKFEVIVGKTGAAQEHQAMKLLREYVAQWQP